MNAVIWNLTWLSRKYYFQECDNSKRRLHVQAKKEDVGMRDIMELVDFFKDMDEETILKLLRLKHQFSRNPGILSREVDTITRLRNNFC